MILFPFCFLLALENGIKVDIANDFSIVNEKCLFDNSDEEIKSFNEISLATDKKRNEVISFYSDGYIKSECVLSSSCYVENKNGANSFINVYFASDIETLSQYAAMFLNQTFIYDDDTSLIVSSGLLKDFGLACGDTISLKNLDQESEQMNFTISNTFDETIGYKTTMFLVVDEFGENLNKIFEESYLYTVHYYSHAISHKVVENGIKKYGLDLTCKNYEIENRFSGYRLIFNKAQTIALSVSIIVFVVSFYCFFIKAKEVKWIENVRGFFYEKKEKNMFFHILSDSLISISATIICLLVSAIINFLVSKTAFVFSLTLTLLIIFKELLTILQSLISYLLIRR